MNFVRQSAANDMPEANQFRTEHFQDAPRGWHVKTITHPSGHEVRLAFPKGPRKRGSGRLVSILHPHENPGCGFSKNPFDWQGDLEDLGRKLKSFVAPHGGAAEGNPRTKLKTAKEVTRGGWVGRSKQYWQTDIEGRVYETKRGKGVKKLPVKPFYIDTATGAVTNPTKPGWRQASMLRKRNYTEEVRTSEGKTVFIDVLGSGEKWTAEGYPVVGGKVRRVGKPVIAHGHSEADAYDNLIDKLERNPLRARNLKAKRNLDEIEAAAKLAEEFKGSPATEIHESGEPDKMRDDFAHLGWEDQMVFVPPTFHGDLDCKAIGDFYHERIEEHDDTARAWKEVQEEFDIPLLVYDVSEEEIRLVCSADRKQLYFIGGNQKAMEGVLKDFLTNLNRDRVDLGELLSTTYMAEKMQAGDEGPRPYYHTFGEDGGYPPGAIYDTLNKRILLFGGTYHLEEADRGIIN